MMLNCIMICLFIISLFLSFRLLLYVLKRDYHVETIIINNR